MKRIILTLFFATYYFFMPFVMAELIGDDKPNTANANSTLATYKQIAKQ